MTDESTDFSRRVRERLRDELYHRRITQTEAATRIRRATGDMSWTYDRVGKILNGVVQLRMDDCKLIADAGGLSMVELVREKGKELVADLTPSELLVVQAMRERPGMEPHLVGIATYGMEKPQVTRRTIRERMRRKS